MMMNEQAENRTRKKFLAAGKTFTAGYSSGFPTDGTSISVSAVLHLGYIIYMIIK